MPYGALNTSDDILVFVKDRADHDVALRNVLRYDSRFSALNQQIDSVSRP